VFWYNGSLIEGNHLELAIEDPGFLYGATVFTTMRVYDRSLSHPLTNWQAHCDRLHNILQSFNWKLPQWKRLQEGAEILLQNHPVLRLTIFPDGRELILGRSLPLHLERTREKGITAFWDEENNFCRSLGDRKTGNYLSAWLALQEAKARGADEAILSDERGIWLETSTGNLWGWKDGCWYTPKANGHLLSGLSRSLILQRLTADRVDVRENIWNLDFVGELEILAYSNCVVEILPIASVITTTKQLHFNSTCPAIEKIVAYFSIP
jgi:4-amino-4-deoxychorismate lyase